MTKTSISLLVLFIYFVVSDANIYNVVKHGAKADGRTDDSQAFLQAWNIACSSKSPSSVQAPSAFYLVKPIILKGPCSNNAITFELGGTLVAPPGNLGQSWIRFQNVNGLTVQGRGTLDGRGQSWWNDRSWIEDGTRSVSFYNCKNVIVRYITSINSKQMHMTIFGSQSVQIHGVRITAPGDSPNTDGIHLQASSDITITDPVIQTGDDCISIGPRTTNVYMQNVHCGPGHGVSIGSLGGNGGGDPGEGVKNITLMGATIANAQNGVRIKSWQTGKGFASDITFRNVKMQQVSNPIIIDQTYCPHRKDCGSAPSFVQIDNVKFINVTGTSAKPNSITLDCSPANPCRCITLRDVNLSGKSECNHAQVNIIGKVIPNVVCSR